MGCENFPFFFRFDLDDGLFFLVQFEAFPLCLKVGS